MVSTMWHIRDRTYVQVALADPATHRHGVRIIYGDHFDLDVAGGMVPDIFNCTCFTLDELVNNYHSYEDLRKMQDQLFAEAEHLSVQDRTMYTVLLKTSESARRVSGAMLKKDCEACALDHPSQRRHLCMMIDNTSFVQEYVAKGVKEIDPEVIALESGIPIEVVREIMAQTSFVQNVIKIYMNEAVCAHS